VVLVVKEEAEKIILILSDLYVVGRTLMCTCTLRNLPPSIDLLRIKIALGLVLYNSILLLRHESDWCFRCFGFYV